MNRTIQSLTLTAALAYSAFSIAADTGWIVGGGIGKSRFTLKPPSGYSVDEAGISQSASSIAYEAFIGYKFNPYISAELGYLDLGEYKISASSGDLSADASARVSGQTLTAIWSYPINKQWRVFARTGLLAGTARTSASVVNRSDGSSATYSQNQQSGILPVWGIGIAYALGDQWEIRGQYQDIGAAKVAESSGTRVKLKDDLWSLNIAYGF